MNIIGANEPCPSRYQISPHFSSSHFLTTLLFSIFMRSAESHVDRSIRTPEVFVQTNVLGTAVMLNCAKAAWELPDGTHC